MEAILQWNLDFAWAIQTLENPPLTVFMLVITSFGSGYLYLVLFPFLFWCIDEKKGIRLGIAVLISVWINLALNSFLGVMPSGHAQNSLVLFFIIASWFEKKWGYICAALLCFLIGFSRIYLGAHFPAGVLAGWITGGVILCGYFLLGGRIESFLSKGGFRTGMIASALVSFMMILYLPDINLIVPGGALLGLGAGYCSNKRYIGFTVDSTEKKYLVLCVRMLLGMAGLLLIFFAAGKLIPRESANIKLYLFIHAAVCGFWVSAAVPWIFVKLRLAGVKTE